MTEPSGPSSVDLQLFGLPIALGGTIAGKYRIDKVLGAGGMGLVLAGFHIALGQRVAIKVLKPGALAQPEFVARFAREARAAAKLRTEHIARVIDVGHMEGGVPFMVMEYLHGQDLSQVVRAKGPLSVADAADFVLQACEALAEAHRAGIIHRDLKPANLFLTKRTDGTPLLKVLDFGISKMTKTSADDSGPSEGLTETEVMMGSPYYMSPEQLKSARTVDARTDIWSLGSVLFKILTGESAFVADSTPELCVAILVGTPRKMLSLRPDLPPAIEAVVAKCLEKDPAARYQTVSELADALAPFAPPQSQPSIGRISRVTASADPLPMPSNPPPAPASVPMTIATTITGSAASVPMRGGRDSSASSSSSLSSPETSQSMAVPFSSSRRPWIFALVAAVGLGIFAWVAINNRKSVSDEHKAPEPTLASQSVGSSAGSGSSPATPLTPSGMASVLPSASVVAAVPSIEPSASASAHGAAIVRPPIVVHRPPTGPATHPTAPRASATSAATSTSTSNVPDFGGRK